MPKAPKHTKGEKREELISVPSPETLPLQKEISSELYEGFPINQDILTAQLMQDFLVWVTDECAKHLITDADSVREAKLKGREWLSAQFNK